MLGSAYSALNSKMVPFLSLSLPSTEVVGGQGSQESRRSSRKLHGHKRYGVRWVTSECDRHFTKNKFFFLTAQTMVDLGKGKTNVDDFAVAIDNNLGEFEFPDDFVIELWTAVEIARNSNNAS